jgi:hypothetical protein
VYLEQAALNASSRRESVRQDRFLPLMVFIDENETSHRYVEPKHEYIFRATLLIIGYIFLSTKA